MSQTEWTLERRTVTEVARRCVEKQDEHVMLKKKKSAATWQSMIKKKTGKFKFKL